MGVEQAKPSVAKSSIILVFSQIVIKLLSFFLLFTLPEYLALNFSGNTVSYSRYYSCSR